MLSASIEPWLQSFAGDTPSAVSASGYSSGIAGDTPATTARSVMHRVAVRSRHRAIHLCRQTSSENAWPMRLPDSLTASIRVAKLLILRNASAFFPQRVARIHRRIFHEWRCPQRPQVSEHVARQKLAPHCVRASCAYPADETSSAPQREDHSLICRARSKRESHRRFSIRLPESLE